ncbi:MAG: hypothetical protein ABMB14_19820 [Myxococcota bacterium]
MRSWVTAVVVGVVLAGSSVGAEAKVKEADKNASPLHTACYMIQDAAWWAQLAFDSRVGWGHTLQAMIELAFLGEAWDAMCAADFGSITRDAPAPGVPSLSDGDGDLLFDEDELVYGLDPGSFDTDRDGLDDDVDPSWLAELLDGLGETRLAAMAALAETDVRAGDTAGAAALLVDVQDALGGCEPDPVTFERSGSEACGAARTLEIHLGLR